MEYGKMGTRRMGKKKPGDRGRMVMVKPHEGEGLYVK